MVVDGGGGAVEFSRDVLGHDVVGLAHGVKVMIEGRVGGGVEVAKVFNSAAEGVDGTEVNVTGHAMSKGFTTSAVLLIGVGEGDIGPLLHVMQRAVTGRDALDKGTVESCVGEPEGLATAAIGSRGEGILTWSAEEEEGKQR